MTFVKGQVTNPAGAKPGNQNAKGGKANLKHGYYSLVKIIRNRRGALDRRTILGKMVLETARQLEADLGGDLSVSFSGSFGRATRLHIPAASMTIGVTRLPAPSGLR